MAGPTDFENWFSADWNKALHTLPDDREVSSNGYSIRDASWDRRAAYLVWNGLGRPRAAWVEQTAALYGRKGDLFAAEDELDLLADAGAEEELDLLA